MTPNLAHFYFFSETTLPNERQRKTYTIRNLSSETVTDFFDRKVVREKVRKILLFSNVSSWFRQLKSHIQRYDMTVSFIKTHFPFALKS